MARVLIPCYGTGPAIVISDDDVVIDSGRVAHKYLDGTWVRLEPSGAVGHTPADAPAAAYEVAAVNDELRIYFPDINSTNGYPFRCTDPGSVPNV